MPDGSPQHKILTRRTRRTGQHFYEALSEEIRLDMVLIPGGTFMMGAPDGEEEALDREKPQHEVTVPQFFMGRYPITQAQWREVAGYPQVDRQLNPDPSDFKGDDRPVEQVDWDDATEFCQRLSQRTDRQYRLPSEAEWEYACRAGTQTPFSFGNYISTELANYDGSEYGESPECESKGETTDVGSYPPNNFGLCDMHGNVWEWCEDDWHESYEGAPTDGGAWLEENRTETKGCCAAVPGFFNPRICVLRVAATLRAMAVSTTLVFVCCAFPREPFSALALCAWAFLPFAPRREAIGFFPGRSSLLSTKL